MTKPTNHSTNEITDNMNTALTGQYNLSAANIIKEAWQLTLKNFGRFAPAVAIFIAFTFTIFMLIIEYHIGGSDTILKVFYQSLPDENKILFLDKIAASSEMVTFFQQPLSQQQYAQLEQNLFTGMIIIQILLAPISASMLLIALHHSIGGVSKIGHIFTGFYKLMPLIIMTVCYLLLQTISSYIPILSFYLVIVFSMAPLLICERGLSPLRSLQISFIAVNRKLMPVIAVHVVIFTCHLLALFITGGIAFIITFPFHFHLVAVLYRNIFGLKNYAQQSDEASSQDNSSDDTSQSNGHFDA